MSQFNRHDLNQRLMYAARVIGIISTPTNIDRLWVRIHEARRGFPSGHEPPTATTELDEDGNPTTTAIGYSDRTGDLATRGRDQVESDLALLAHLTAQLDRCTRGLIALHQRYAQAAPYVRYCTSCQRDGGHHEPVSSPRYADACRFCGDSRAANGGEFPPLAILRAHRRRQPITEQLIAAHPLPNGQAWRRTKVRTSAA